MSKEFSNQKQSADKQISSALKNSTSYLNDEQKRRHQKQNNDIIRVNAMYATQLRKSESDKKLLADENLELRKELSKAYVALNEEQGRNSEFAQVLEKQELSKKDFANQVSLLADFCTDLQSTVVKLQAKIAYIASELDSDLRQSVPQKAVAAKLDAKFPSKANIKWTKKQVPKTFSATLETILEEPLAEAAATASKTKSYKPRYIFSAEDDRMELVTSPQPGYVSETFLNEPASRLQTPPKNLEERFSSYQRQKNSSKYTIAGYSPPSSPPLRQPALQKPKSPIKYTTPLRSTRQAISPTKQSSSSASTKLRFGDTRKPNSRETAPHYKPQSPPSSPPRTTTGELNTSLTHDFSLTRSTRNKTKTSYQLPPLNRKLRQGMDFTIDKGNPYGVKSYTTTPQSRF